MKLFIKTLLIIFLFSCCMVVNSCNRDHLDLLPHGPTEQSYFVTEDEFDRAVLGVYAKMSDFFWFNTAPGNSTISAFLLPGDDITTNQSNEEFEIFGPLQPSSGRVSYLFSRHYQMINRANVVLQKIAEVKDGVYQNPDLKNHHNGEALFLRGYAFYNLWIFYGTAPLVIERPESSDQFTPPGTTGTQLLDQAIKDFTEAETLLPATWDVANRGRVTANSAHGMLGKSLVFRGSATKNTADYTAAISAFNKISGAALVSNFTDNFAWDTENNAESLFEYQSGGAFSEDNVWLGNDFDNAIGSFSVYWGFYSNNSTGQQGRSRFFGTTKLLNAYSTNDPRRAATLNPTDRTVRKYASRDKETGSGVGSMNNYRILRYADVLLLKAEAILQSGGSTADAIALINEVRGRARAMVPASVEPANRAVSETNKETIMTWIMNERFLELAGEGQRWPDIKRWQLQSIISLDNAFFSSNLNTVSFQPAKHLNFPIPSNEIDVNPNISQNPGY